MWFNEALVTKSVPKKWFILCSMILGSSILYIFVVKRTMLIGSLHIDLLLLLLLLQIVNDFFYFYYYYYPEFKHINLNVCTLSLHYLVCQHLY